MNITMNSTLVPRLNNNAYMTLKTVQSTVLGNIINNKEASK